MLIIMILRDFLEASIKIIKKEVIHGNLKISIISIIDNKKYGCYVVNGRIIFLIILIQCDSSSSQ